MIRDEKAPEELFSLQKWFGNLITEPLAGWDEMGIPLLHEPFLNEAKILIRPSKTLTAEQRISIYRYQYWFRLFRVLKDDYPLLLRLFGPKSFEKKIAEPYLLRHPSNSFTLNVLGKNLSKWLEEEYVDEDKSLVVAAAKVDYAFNTLFTAPSYPSLEITKIEENPIFLQPFVFVFKAGSDILTFREKMLEEDVEHWLSHDFPELKWDRKYYFVIYRFKSSLLYKEIPIGQYLLLKAFEMGATLENACSFLEDLPEKERKESEENIQTWFQEWVQNQWLTIKNA